MFPPEVISEFLQYVAFPKDLLNFALVCKSWSPVAQSMLFREATLNLQAIPLFCRTLEESPHLYTLVKNLVIDGSEPLLELLLDPLQQLRGSSNVSSLCLFMSAGDKNRRLLFIPPTHLDDDATTYEPADLKLYTN